MCVTFYLVLNGVGLKGLGFNVLILAIKSDSRETF